MSRAYSPTFLSLHLRHNSFSNPSVALPTSQLILQPFHCLTYVTSFSLNSHGELCSFSNLSVTSPTSKLILQPFRRFTYVTAHSPILPLLHLRHSWFSNPSFDSPTSQAHLIDLTSRPWYYFYSSNTKNFLELWNCPHEIFGYNEMVMRFILTLNDKMGHWSSNIFSTCIDR